jgi:hypothetical protein
MRGLPRRVLINMTTHVAKTHHPLAAASYCCAADMWFFLRRPVMQGDQPADWCTNCSLPVACRGGAWFFRGPFSEPALGRC